MLVFCNGKKINLTATDAKGEKTEVMTYDFPSLLCGLEREELITTTHPLFPKLRLHVWNKTLGINSSGKIYAKPVYPVSITQRKPGTAFLVVVPGSTNKGLARVMPVSIPREVEASKAKISRQTKVLKWYPGILQDALK